jgi:fructose-1,6-bisphosphatase I
MDVIQFMQEEQRKHGGHDIVGLMENITAACRKIATAVNRGAFVGMMGSAGSENIQGGALRGFGIRRNGRSL